MNEQMTFKRYELKYMLTRAQKEALLRAVQRRDLAGGSCRLRAGAL